MNVSTINSFIVVCLLSMVFLFVLFHGGDVLYDNRAPLKPAYNISGNADEKVPSPIAKINETSLPMRLQNGSLENGIKVFGQCAVCHSPVKNGPNRVGPNLWGVVDRSPASLSNFSYSRAMRDQNGKVWNFATLDHYLKSPRAAVPGTAMSFLGIKNDQDRADLLLYLRNLSDKPAILPSVDAPATSADIPLK